MPKAKKVSEEEPLTQDAESTHDAVCDWQSSETLQMTQKWGGLVTLYYESDRPHKKGLKGKHIDGYNLDAVLRGGFFKIKAPVFSHPYVVVQTIVVIIITLCVTAGFYTMHESGFMHVDPSIAAKADGIFGYFSGLSGFLFGFFVFNGLGGYLTVKNNYLGGFWGAAQNLFCLVAVFFPETDKKNKLLKLTLLRWTCASFHIMCGSVNDLTTMPEVLQKAKDKNLLTDHEAEQTEGNAVIPLLWMMQVVGDQIYARKLPGAELKDSAAGGLILKMRSGIGGVACACSSFGLTPLPLVHLMSALVKMQLFLLAIKEGVEIAGILVDDSEGKLLQISFCALMLVVTPIIFQGLLEFVIMVNNPFGDDWVDYPIALYHKQIRDELAHYCRAGEGASDLKTLKEVLP